MASPETNKVRIAFGMDPEPPFVVDLPYSDPKMPSEFVANAMATIHNQAELGKITNQEAYDRIHELDDMRAEWGDGWIDRYGPLPEY